MSHIRIDKSKALKKWTPVLENMGIKDDTRLDWMSEYAEFHSINENAYNNAGLAGMGAVLSPQPGAFPGVTVGANAGSTGSGDLGQNLLPVAMKIAAQTIGLDLVAVKPTPGPKIDLLYIDFQYDDVADPNNNERPQVFKINDGLGTVISDVITELKATMVSKNIVETVGGLTGGRLFITISTGAVSTTEPTTKTGIVEFLGFSRIDGLPMFRAYRQANAVGTSGYSASPYQFDVTKNTFGPTTSMVAQLVKVSPTIALSGAVLNGTSVELISALEDHIPGFVSNFTGGGAYPMNRETDDSRYSGVIGPKVSSKSVAVGTIEVSSSLRRTEIEDIKANTGMDIVQKMESVLVNELSQTVSKQIVSKIFEMGDLNRTSAPLRGGAPIFDLDTAYAGTTVGGETTHAVQRKLITKIVHASNYIATEGRVGPAQYLVTNGGLAATLQDVAGYTINPTKSKMNGNGQLYPVGQIGDITIYVDPYMKYDDNRIVLGRKNNPDQPGIIFVPYLMAQSVNIISEATFAPRMLLRSRYAVTEVGWYPQKQYMTVKVTDADGLLN